MRYLFNRQYVRFSVGDVLYHLLKSKQRNNWNRNSIPDVSFKYPLIKWLRRSLSQIEKG
jgi:DNA-binding HxlR family transcriptional regulator